MLLRGRAKIIYEVIKTKKVERVDSSYNEEDYMLKQLDMYQEEREDAYEEGKTLADDQSKESASNSYTPMSKPTVLTMAKQVSTKPPVIEQNYEDNLYPTAVGLEEDRDYSTDPDQEEDKAKESMADKKTNLKHY